MQPTRWVYGLPGLLIAQTLAFTPIAFLVLIGVVEGVSPSMEEAAQTLARQPLADLPDRHAAADAPGPRQRLPARLHREHGRLRQPAGARRQFRRALDRDLLRHRRRPERPGHGGDARRRAAGLHARRLLRPALLARPPLLHHRLGQGRRRHPSAAAAPRCDRRSTPSSAPGSPYAADLRHHRLRQLRQALGRRLQPDARPLREGLRRSAGPSTACTGAARPGRSFWTTIWIALVSAPLTAAIGLLTAWLLVRAGLRRQARLRVRRRCSPSRSRAR